MVVERTLSIIKPDAVARNLIGTIVKVFEDNDIKVQAMLMKKLSQKEAQSFYIEHKERPFYGSLVAYMTSGPVVLMVLEGNNAVERNRKIMGATNPAHAEEGTIRKMYAESLERNSVHGSDSPTSAQREINFFFPNL
ncbi:MAG: nucleoside-diphosphate kinase [Deltaproteobacteria bacterium]|nr:nucleoside-diphosphate kinase [Deltaproteobacteria bacterium]